jgi:hypothetical protein
MSKLEALSAKSAPELKETVYYKDILKTKANRVAYTRRYLSTRLHPKHKPNDFLKKAAKLLGLKNPSDDMFFNVFYIQMKLKFPLIPKSERHFTSGFPTYIDMKYGDFTHDNLLRQKDCTSLNKYFKDFYKVKRKKFAYNQNLPYSGSAARSPYIASVDTSGTKKNRYVTPGAMPLAAVPAIKSRPGRRNRGGLSFNVDKGQYLTENQYADFRRERTKAYARSKMGIVERMQSFQQEYDYIEALKVCIKMLGIPKRQWKAFLAFIDATARTESGYHVNCTPGTGYRKGREGKMGLRKVWGPERGMFQLFTKYYRGVRKDIHGRKRRPGINYDALAGIEFPNVRAERLSLFRQTIVFIYQYAANWRTYSGMHMGDILEQIQSAPNERMRKQWGAMLYLRHRNGVNGSRIFRTLLKRGILFPEEPSQARAYFERYLKGKTWQGRRPFPDFKRVARQTMGDPKTKKRRFIQRFILNMRQLKGVDVDKLFKTS